MKRIISSLLAILAAASTTFAAEPQVIHLWAMAKTSAG